MNNKLIPRFLDSPIPRFPDCLVSTNNVKIKIASHDSINRCDSAYSQIHITAVSTTPYAYPAEVVEISYGINVSTTMRCAGICAMFSLRSNSRPIHTSGGTKNTPPKSRRPSTSRSLLLTIPAIPHAESRRTPRNSIERSQN